MNRDDILDVLLIAFFSFIVGFMFWTIVSGVTVDDQGDELCQSLGYDRLDFFKRVPFCIKIVDFDAVESIKLVKVDTVLLPLMRNIYEVSE